ncbi:hypothetical protein D3C81_2075910 [compost metagenome]
MCELARYIHQNAYLAAYHGRIAHCACVKIVREALREPGQALPAGAAHFVDTTGEYQLICSEPATRPDVEKCGHRSSLAPPSQLLPDQLLATLANLHLLLSGIS